MSFRPRPITPLGALARGLTAAAAGTAAMDALWYWRYRRGGGEDGVLEWEFSSGLDGWDEAPAPALVGKRLVEGLFEREIPSARVGLVNNVTHWAYGILGGAGYGLVVGSLRHPKALYGPLFGTAVWASGYVVLPLAHLYKPIWEYDVSTLAGDLSAHLVYGTTTAAVFRLLAR